MKMVWGLLWLTDNAFVIFPYLAIGRNQEGAVIIWGIIVPAIVWLYYLVRYADANPNKAGIIIDFQSQRIAHGRLIQKGLNYCQAILLAAVLGLPGHQAIVYNLNLR